MKGGKALKMAYFRVFCWGNMDLKDANAQHTGFTGKVRSALFWRSGSQILAQIISWMSTLIVIRLLNPSDYGLFAMTQAIFSFMQFLNGYGLVSALVQSETLDTHRLRQAFGIMLLLNGGLALQLVIAPYAADYYDQPLVADMLRVQALIYLATPFISVAEVLMGRSLDFRRPAIVSLIASAVAAVVALVGALSGWGVWTWYGRRSRCSGSGRWAILSQPVSCPFPASTSRARAACSPSVQQCSAANSSG